MRNKIVFDRDERDLLVAFAGCSLDKSPGSNWVERAGGLPEYICEIAKDIHEERGKTVSQAIAIAVSRVKKWATGVGVSKQTQAKAAKALAEWEKLRAKSHAKSAAKKSAHTLAASHHTATVDSTVLNLTDYNMDTVRSAFQARNNDIRRAWRKANPNAAYDDGPQSLYVKEVWNTFLIVQSDYGRDADLYKVPYTVDDNADVTFGDAVEVKTEYVVVDEGGDDDPADAETEALLKKVQQMSASAPTGLDRVLTLAATRRTALDKVLALANTGKDSGGKDYANTKAKRYADPGYQDDGKKRYALDTADQVRAAWSYINQQDNAGKYSPADLAKVKAAIKRAAKDFGIDIAD